MERQIIRRARAALLAIGTGLAPAAAQDMPVVQRPSPAAEFDAPYAIGVLAGGETIEVTGSFSWAMPQMLSVALAQAPRVRTVRFGSPGGHIQPALEIADMIKARGLNTEVERLCASACTLAFLAGRQRVAGPRAQIGFHQAHRPGLPPELFDPLMRQAYRNFGVPDGFIDHVLRTPPQSLWVPTHAELLAARIITVPSPEAVPPPDGTVSERRAIMALLQTTSDDAVIGYTAALTAMLSQLQRAGPEICWQWLNHEPVDLREHVSEAARETMRLATDRVRIDAALVPVAPADAAARTQILRTLVDRMRAGGQGDVLAAMAPSGVHALFCPSLNTLLRSAVSLPDAQRVPALRALFAGGRG
jgi:hypothetical protein